MQPERIAPISTPLLADEEVARDPALQEPQARDRLFDAIFQDANDGVVIWDDAARYLDGNGAVERLLGMAQSQIRLRSLHDLSSVAPEATEAAWQRFLREGRQVGEWSVHGADGAVRTLSYSAIANVLPGRHVSIWHDTTEEKQAQATRQRLGAIVEAADDAIIGEDLDGRVTDWNPAAERIFGFAAADIIGRPMTTLVPADRVAERLAAQARVHGGDHVRHLETTGRRLDDSQVDVSLSVSPIRDLDGRVVGVCTIARDIGETKRLRARLAMADRMVSIGTMAAGVAHEINNPMAAVIANVDVAVRDLGKLADTQAGLRGLLIDVVDALHDAGDAAGRVQHIVRDLRTLSRSDDERQAPVDVRRALESSLRIAWNEIRHRARVVRDYQDVPTVDGNESRLGQVFINLLVNAAQAIPEGNAEDNQIVVATRVDGDSVVIEISDTGEGISPDRMQRVFEPFYTTKPEGIGTGLGMFICQGIVTGMGGDISVAATSGQGSTIRVILPRGELAAHRPRSQEVPMVTVGRRARLLVVDDEELVIKAVSRILSPYFDVAGATDARLALQWLRDGERFDAVICDLMMPQMSGMDFYASLGALQPALCERVIFATGGVFTKRAREFLEQVSTPYVEKPFNTAGLVGLVTRLLS